MENYTMISTDFWENPMVSEGMMMTAEDKLFYLYLLTSPHTNHIGIYQITRKQMAFDLGYSIDCVHLLMRRFIEHYKLIRYNPETREVAIKNWGEHNHFEASKQVLDCIVSDLKDVEDPSLIKYVLDSIQKPEIRDLYESFCKQ
jgi:hypothetical protein